MNLSHAEYSSQKLELLIKDSIHYAEDGTRVIINLNSLKEYLNNGGDPDWVENKYKRTILGKFFSFTSHDYIKSVSEETYRDSIKSIKLLIKFGAKIDHKYNTEILFNPIVYNRYEMVQILLENGVNLDWNKQKIGGFYYERSPVGEAYANGHDDIVDLLIEYGAKPLSKQNILQLRLIEAAREGSRSDLRKLIDQGAYVDGNILETNRYKNTALLHAIGFIGGALKYSNYEKVEFLLEQGADPNKIGKSYAYCCYLYRPLHVAVKISTFPINHDKNSGNANDSYESRTAKKILSVLIDYGAHVSGRDENNMTPLHHAAKESNIYATRLLLKNNAKVMSKDDDGKTPLDYAESGEIIRLLKKHGARE